MLTATTLTWAGASGTIWDVGSTAEWENSLGQTVVWTNGDIAQFPAITGTTQLSPAVVNLSAANGLVYASQIVFLDTTTPGGTTTSDSYYSIQSYAGSGDQLELDPGGTTAVADQVTSGTTTVTEATFAAPIVESTCGVNTFTIGSGNTGTVVLAAGTSLEAYSVAVASGTFDVEGSVTVDSTTTASGSMTVSGSAVLQGTNTGASIDLASDTLGTHSSSFVWESTTPGQFLGGISGPGDVTIAGTSLSDTLTLGFNQYTGGTTITGGKLVFGSHNSVPGNTALDMSGTATVDLNGNGPDPGMTLTELTGGQHDTITNSSPTTSVILDINGTNTSVFSGTIEDGTGGITVYLQGTALDLSNGSAHWSGKNDPGGISTLVTGSDLTLNIANCSPQLLATEINVEDAIVTFYVPSGSRTYSGFIHEDPSFGVYGYVHLEKTGAGTLTLAPSTANSDLYTRLDVLGGTLIYGNSYAASYATSGLDVEGGGALDLGGQTVDFGYVTLGDGSITDGAFRVLSGGAITVEDGEIAADIVLTSQQLIKDGSGTVVLAGAAMQVGTTEVNDGTLEVDGTLSPSGVLVNSGGGTGVLSGDGEILGPVTIYSGGTLALGGSGGIFTMSALTLNSGSLITDNTSSGLLTLTDVTGALTINGGTVSLTSGSVALPFQVLFHYGSGGTGLLTPPSGLSIINNSAASEIEMVYGTAVFWSAGGSTPGGTGNWTSTGSNWLSAPSGGTAGTWTNGDVAVFLGTGDVTITGSGFNPTFDTMLFDGGAYTLGGNAFGGFRGIGESECGDGHNLRRQHCSGGYSGETELLDGTLKIGSASALGSGAGTLLADGGVLDLYSYLVAMASVSGNELTIADSSTSADGTLEVGGNSALGALTVNSGTFDLGGYTVATSFLGGSGGTIQDGELDVDVAGALVSDTYAGILSVDLVKTGSGQLKLTGSNLNFVNDGSNGGFGSLGDLYIDTNNTLEFGGTFTNYGSLTIQGVIEISGTLINDGGLINMNNELLNDGTIDNIDGGELEIRGELDLYYGTITNAATIEVQGSLIITYGELDSSSSVIVDGTLDNGSVINNSGSIVVDSGGTLIIDSSGTLANTGNLEIGSHGDMENNGTFINNNSAVIDAYGVLNNNAGAGLGNASGGTFDIYGTLNDSYGYAGYSSNAGVFTVHASGQFNLTNGSIFVDYGTVDDAGGLYIDSTSFFYELHAMTVDASGNVTNYGEFVDGTNGYVGSVAVGGRFLNHGLCVVYTSYGASMTTTGSGLILYNPLTFE